MSLPPLPPPPPPPSAAQCHTRKKWGDPVKQGKASAAAAVGPLPVTLLAAPASDLEAFWQVRSIRRSDTGSGGVWFVELPVASASGLAVLKTTGSVASDWFALELGRLLRAPLPFTRVLEPQSAEVFAATFGCLECLAAQSGGGDSCRGGSRTLFRLGELARRAPSAGSGSFSRPYMQLMECVSCVTGEQLLEAPAGPARRALVPGFAAEQHLPLVGRLLALDALLNNYDRLPLGNLWKYVEQAGNLHNIAFRANGEPVGFDQSLTSISPIKLHARYEEYAAEVHSIVCFAHEHRYTTCDTDNPFAAAAALLEDLLGLTLPAGESVRLLCEGFAAAADLVCTVTDDQLGEIYRRISAPLFLMLDSYDGSVTEETVGMNRIDKDYLCGILDAGFGRSHSLQLRE
eukprot:TRINITY_DN2374_c0_g1_i3.p1 TRINITY_DN2374_c0_g1~~TRINITY_DN2374_c0_g1_i3.p1  ORF type:complete len:403 (-),score=98.20 TRINITY_DN2374_c0_g1_i3:635-1843(-)